MQLVGANFGTRCLRNGADRGSAPPAAFWRELPLAGLEPPSRMKRICAPACLVFASWIHYSPASGCSSLPTPPRDCGRRGLRRRALGFTWWAGHLQPVNWAASRAAAQRTGLEADPRRLPCRGEQANGPMRPQSWCSDPEWSVHSAKTAGGSPAP